MPKKKKKSRKRRSVPSESREVESCSIGTLPLIWAMIVIAGYTVFWLIPMCYEGLKKERVYSQNWQSFPVFVQDFARHYPPFLENLARVSCLFTRSVPAWGDYYFQLKFVESPDWITLREEDYSVLEPFGHHSRLDLMLAKSVRGDRSLQRFAIAQFIRDRYRQLNPEQRMEVEAVRFVKVVHRSDQKLAAKKGPWIKQPLDSLPEERRRVDSTHYFDRRAWKSN